MLHGQQKCHHIVYIIIDVPDHLISIINIIIITLTIWLTRFLCLEKIRINQKKFG